MFVWYVAHLVLALFSGCAFGMESEEIVKTYNAVTSIADPRSDVRLAVIKYLEKK